MKTTGMVRRIDELGRIVIPKEIRKQLMLKEGESVSFSLEDEHIILTKFSMLNKMGPSIQILLDGLQAKYQNIFLLTNNHQVIAASSDGLTQYQRKYLPSDIVLAIESQKVSVEVSRKFLDAAPKMTILPLVIGQESKGALIMLTNQTPYIMIDETLLHFVQGVIEREIEACA